MTRGDLQELAAGNGLTAEEALDAILSSTPAIVLGKAIEQILKDKGARQ